MLFATLAILGWLPTSAEIQAQQIIRLEDFSPCRDCALRTVPLLQLGEAEGGGMVEVEHSLVIYHPEPERYAVYNPGGLHLDLFDAAGSFLRSIGREGQGPGELSGIVDAKFTEGGDVAILDSGHKWLVLGQDGAVVSENRTGVPRYRFRIVSGDTVVVGAVARHADYVGFPLHLATLAGGPALKHFGSIDGRYSASDAYNELVFLGRTITDGGIWHGKPPRLRLEEWTTAEQLRRVIVGDFDWFPEVHEWHRRGSGEPPPVLLSDFTIDEAERLWILTRHPDPQWRTVDLVGGPEGGRLLSADQWDYFDIRLDVFDLRGRQHLGTHVFDAAFAYVLDRTDDIVVSVVEYDESIVPRVVLYGLDLVGTGAGIKMPYR